MTWHADEVLLGRYTAGSLDPARASSVEAHVLECVVCRERLGPLADQGRLERVWSGIQLEIDAPRPGPVEALLARFGLSEHLARLLAATPSLSLSWLVAVAVTLAFAVTAAYQGPRGALFFLVVAPLLPVAGVAAAYGPGIDPTYEVGLSSPMSRFRLLLMRTTAVLVTTTALAGLATLGLPGLDWAAAAWLLPALALTLASLALATWVAPIWAAGWVTFVWIAAVTLTERAAEPTLTAFRAPAQLVFLSIVVVAAWVVATRRERFELRSER